MAIGESWTLDGLSLSNGNPFQLVAVSAPPGKKRAEWISGADLNGAILARDPTSENVVIEMRLMVAAQATGDLAIAKIAELEDKLQECSRNIPDGLPLVWTPSDATTSATYRCLMGEITERPTDWESGWMSKAPTLTIQLTCGPFMEGAEYQVATVTSSAPIVTLELTGIPGDVPALGRLIVTDAASQSRRYMAWGLESRWYPTSGALSLIIDSAQMSISGYAAAAATRTGAYIPSGAANEVLGATLRPQVQGICGLHDQGHLGSFRPQLRCYASATTIAIRLSYQVHDGPFRSLTYRVPTVVGWNHIDLGLITVPPTALGTQRWTGRIEAYSTATGGETLDVDAIWLMPAERYGRARGTYAYRPGVTTSHDHFVGAVAASALNGRVATIGGTWATSGVTGDFTAYTDETMYRNTVSEASPRYAILGSTNYTNTEVSVLGYQDTAAATERNVLARWVDSSNHLRLRLAPTGNDQSMTLSMSTIVAGAATATVSTYVGARATLTNYYLRIVVYASGRAIGTLLTLAGATLAQLNLTSSALATGGTLATGKPGFADRNATAIATFRAFDAFYAATPPAEPIACHSGQSIEFRHDTTLREDSTGTYAGPPPEYVGGRFLIPNAGGPARKARVAVIARRNDVEVMADDDLSTGGADDTVVTVFATPRYLAIPR